MFLMHNNLILSSKINQDLKGHTQSIFNHHFTNLKCLHLTSFKMHFKFLKNLKFNLVLCLFCISQQPVVKLNLVGQKQNLKGFRRKAFCRSTFALFQKWSHLPEHVSALKKWQLLTEHLFFLQQWTLLLENIFALWKLSLFGALFASSRNGHFCRSTFQSCLKKLLLLLEHVTTSRNGHVTHIRSSFLPPRNGPFVWSRCLTSTIQKWAHLEQLQLA